MGVRVTSIVTTLGLFCEVTMTLVLGGILIATNPHQPVDVVFSRQVAGFNHNADWSAFFPAMLSMAYVFYGFESAADVSEEVVAARKTVPRAMILSLSVSFIDIKL
jgi:amino acid transporter